MGDFDREQNRTPAPGAERREAERYHLRLDAFVTACGGPRFTEPVCLTSRDVSVGGAYFITSEPLPVGTPVEVDLVMEIGDAPSPGAGRAWVRVAGVVQRTDPRGMVICFERDSKILPFLIQAAPPP